MRLMKRLHRRPLIATTTVLACLVVGAAVWQASRQPATAAFEGKQQLQNELRKGIGSEVRFASRAENAEDAVASAAEFIHGRSGWKMSDDFKKRLAKAERDVLNGKSGYISVSELTDRMTTAVVDRLATLTDKEIDEATEASTDENGEIRSRASAKWGVLTKQGLVQQAQAGREWSRRGDAALQVGLRSMIEGEVNDRVSKLGTNLPEQFGNVSSKGLTPTQAFVIAYSVAADDPLTNSRAELGEMLKQQRMAAGLTREQWQAQKNHSALPYGPHGWLHPSAAQLFFTRNSVNKMLNLTEGGEKQ